MPGNGSAPGAGGEPRTPAQPGERQRQKADDNAAARHAANAAHDARLADPRGV